MGGDEAGAGGGVVGGGVAPVVPVATSVVAEAALLASTRVVEADQTVRYLHGYTYRGGTVSYQRWYLGTHVGVTLGMRPTMPSPSTLALHPRPRPRPRPQPRPHRSPSPSFHLSPSPSGT